MGNWKFDEVIVLDIEATCWPTKQEQERNFSEIIEIGICKMNTMTGEVSDARSIVVKPMFSEVSDFCTELTGHTQEGVNKGISLVDAMNIVKKDYGLSRKILACYGNYDGHKIVNECQRKNIDIKLPPTYLNISAIATLKLKANKRLGLARACARFGMEFQGRQHSGMDDAVMAAKVLWECSK